MHYSGDQAKKNKMGGICIKCGEWRREVNVRFWWGILMERDQLKDQSVDGKLLLKCIFKKCDGVWIGSGS
jgi:hypothetical protein